LKEFDIEIEGLRPLLMHSPTGISDVSTTRQSGKPDYSQEAEKALYRDEDGTIFVPASWIEGTLRKGSTNFKIPGRGKKTYKDLMLSSVEVDPQEIKIVPQKYEIDCRSVVVQRSRIIRYRPIFKKWHLSFCLRLLDDQLDETAIKEILQYAGSYVGVGDFRPKYGLFKVNSLTERHN
jgi:hypothetical protein